jgi:non-specific serine/threonine protein kinase
MGLFGAAEGIDRVRWRPAGLANSFGFTTHFATKHWQALASSALDESAVAEALSAGRAMSVADAVAYALKPSVESASSSAHGVRDTGRESALTSREQEVAALLAGGRTNREIAQTLVITVSTAERHVANILNKLGLRSRTEVALWAVAQSLEGPPKT